MSNPSGFSIRNSVLIKYGGPGGDVVIPEDVIKIDKMAFFGCGSLTSVTIPGSVTSIGEDAFTLCRSLTSVTISEGVITIGRRAFTSCSSLTSVTIPESVTSIGYDAFYDCKSLTSVTIPDGVMFIGGSAFLETPLYRDIDRWENGVFYLGKHLIKAIPSLSGHYTVKEGTTSIANGAFAECGSLTGITIPDSVTYIGDYAFNRCKGLADSNSFVIIRDTLFDYFGPGGEVVIPGSVKRISSGAFSGCKNISRAVFPKDTESIPDSEFYMSTKTFYEAVIYDSYPKANEGRLTETFFPQHSSQLTYRASYVVTVKSAETDEVKFRILHSGETETVAINTALIDAWRPGGDFDFKVLDGLFSSYKTIKLRLITAMFRLNYPVDLGEDMQKTYASFVKRNGSKWFPDLIKADRADLIQWFMDRGAVTKGNVDAIIDLAAQSARPAITAMLMEYKAKKIGSTNSVSTLSVKAPRPVKLWEVKRDAPEIVRRYNGSEIDVTFPIEINGVAITGVADTVFKKPDNYMVIERIVIPEGYTSIGKDAFSGMPRLREVFLPSSLRSLGENCFRACNALKSVTLPETLKKIPNHAFSGCSDLVQINFPRQLTSIGDEAFRGCTALREVDLGETFVSLGDKSFYETYLDTVVFRGKKCSAWRGMCFNYPASVYSDGVIDALGIPGKPRPLIWLAVRTGELAASAGSDFLKGLSVCSYGHLGAFNGRSLNSDFSGFITSLGGKWTATAAAADLIVAEKVDPEDLTVMEGHEKGAAFITEADFLQTIRKKERPDPAALRQAVASALRAVQEGDPYLPTKMQALWRYTQLEDGSIRLDSYLGKVTEVEIPPRIGDKPVRSIGDGALSPSVKHAANREVKKAICSVTIPEGVSIIGDRAFYKCVSLKEVKISAKTISIGWWAFKECPELTIYGPTDSVARKYAIRNKIAYVRTDEGKVLD